MKQNILFIKTKFICLCIISFLGVSLTNCSNNEYEKFYDALSEFQYDSSNGYDYSLIQEFYGIETNSNFVKVRFDQEDEKAQKEINIKRLNSEFGGSQYIESTVNAIYEDGKQKTANESKRMDIEEFIGVNFSELDLYRGFEEDLYSNQKISSKKDYLTITIEYDNIDELFDKRLSIEKMKIYIYLNEEGLEKFKISYSQELTDTTIIFEPYYGEVDL